MDGVELVAPQRGTVVALLALWLLATALNIAKPFHIDDTAHLLIAESIANNPLRPMSGMLNWLDTSEPIFVTNQPHFFYYLIAGVVAVFGVSELALHLFLSLFVGLAIWVSYRLACRFIPDQALLVAAALVLSPGFLINQNVLADIPLLAMIGLAVLVLTRAGAGGKAGAAGFGVFSLALLTKYTALFLFPALIWASLQKRVILVWVVLPVLALTGWSLFNIYDFGEVHILSRPANVGGLFPSPKLGFAFIANMGVFAVPIATLMMVSTRLKWLWIAIWLASLAAFYFVTLIALNLSAEKWMLLNAALFASGSVVGAAVIWRVWQLMVSLWESRAEIIPWYRENFAEITLLIWLAGGAAFLATFPPFMATRHALMLTVPFFILALRSQTLIAPPRSTAVVLTLWGLVGVFTTLNDIQFARFYRDQAPIVAARAFELAGPKARVFVRGHWGWQWYVRKSGMIEYDSVRSDLNPGDILVDPVEISAQKIADIAEFEVLEVISQPSSIFTRLDTHRFYASGAVADPVFAAGFTRQIRILRKDN